MGKIAKLNQRDELNPCDLSDHVTELQRHLRMTTGAVRTALKLSAHDAFVPPDPVDFIGFLELLDEHLTPIEEGLVTLHQQWQTTRQCQPSTMNNKT